MSTEPTMIERPDGTKEWWLNGKLHRLGGPAVEYTDGTKEWWLNSKMHRLGGPAVEYADGTKEWWLNGKLHRLGGPAVEHADGTKEWCQKGRLHRLDGPAVERANGTKEWYYGDIDYTPGPAVEFLAYDPVSGYGLLFDGTEYRAGCKRAATVEEALQVFKQGGHCYPSCAQIFLDAVEKHAAEREKPE